MRRAKRRLALPRVQASRASRALDAVLQLAEQRGGVVLVHRGRPAGILLTARQYHAALTRQRSRQRNVLAELDAMIRRGENDAVMRGLADELDDAEFESPFRRRKGQTPP